jgi:hypothetical protein
MNAPTRRRPRPDPEDSHFHQRVRERLWPVFGPIDAAALHTALRQNLRPECPHVEYVCRISRDGRRLWRILMPGDRHFYALAHHNDEGVWPMTVLLPGMRIAREGKSSLRLK